MPVSTEVREGVGIIRVAGDLDLTNALELQDVFLALLSDGARGLVIDCKELTFIDSTGLNALVSANRAANLQFGTVTIRNPSPMVVRLLQVTGLDRFLIIEL
jgi:anti-sigma B factor antagonist